MNGTIERELFFEESVEAVWAALTTSESLAEWMHPNDFVPKLGHRFTFDVPPNPAVNFEGLAVRCEVLELVPLRRLAFSWKVEGLDTVVGYRLEPEGAGTKVFFTHAGFERPQAFGGAQYGWKIMHDKLAALLARAF